MARFRWVSSIILGLGVWAALGFRFWEPAGFRSPTEPLIALAPHSRDSSMLMAASETSVYLRKNSQRWTRIFSLSNENSAIQKLITHPQSPEKILLLTPAGVLEGDLKSSRLKWLYRDSKNLSHSLALDSKNPLVLYLATQRGLFQSADGGRTWLAPSRWPENQEIEFAATSASRPGVFFIATSRELFFSKDSGLSFESGFSLSPSLEETAEEDRDEESPAETRRRFTSLAASHINPEVLWTGTSEGIFETKDGGESWERLPDRGLQETEVRDLIYSDRRKALFAASGRSVYRYLPRQRRWEKLKLNRFEKPASLGLQSLSEKEILLIASGHEILEFVIEPSEALPAGGVFLPSPERMELFRKLVALEPTPQEIHRQAIRYGELGGGRIRRWHWGSRLRALVPSLSFGKDLSFNANVDIDRGSTSEPDRFIAGPEEIDKGWGLDLNWDLGDLIWSSSQTSIDSRAKLLVELRESILSQVNRIYFERRRMQMEIILLPAETPLPDRLDLLLGLDELTAQLDTLTDGFLSERLKTLGSSLDLTFDVDSSSS